MCKSSISLELKLGEVEYIDENNIIVPVYMRQKGFKEYKKFFDWTSMARSRIINKNMKENVI